MSDSEARLTAVLGPTNTGKTHLALERLIGHRSGMIGFPLRLLARENYDRLVKVKGVGQVALVTGEEKIIPPGARYFVCTVESMPVDRPVAFLAVDEIQLAADAERGHIFTDRLLRARGLEETMVMGSESISKWIRALVPKAEFIQRPRFSTLTYVGPKKITRLPPRSAIVAFSAAEVYAIADLIRRQRGGTAIVMGALSPRTRNAQVEMYQAGEVDYLVATDAIGMGLNMDVNHVCFAALRKFDGRVARPLTKAEISQIAGRAGRHMSDGTFGTTAEVGPMDPEIVDAVENHRVEPLTHLMWRRADLDFRSVDHLMRSLETRPPHPGLIRQQEAEDHQSLHAMARDPEIAALAQGRERVALLWDICQVPDFRKLMTDAHVRLLAQLYHYLIDGALPADWVADQIARLDRVDGDIDQLTQRISHVRTWSFIVHRGDWVTDPAQWQARTQAIEDRLSDALHQALTQRFVDRRRAALHRRLKSGSEMMAVVNAANEVIVEGHVVGDLIGFHFTPQGGTDVEEARPLLAAARRVLAPALADRAAQLTEDADGRFRLSESGEILWRGAIVAQLRSGDGPLHPRIELRVDDLLDGGFRRMVQARLKSWLEASLRRRLKPLFELMQAELSAPARGLAYQIAEALGALPRRRLAQQIAQLGKEDRRRLRALGLRLGRETVWLPALSGRATRRLLVRLQAIHAQNEKTLPDLSGDIVTLPESLPDEVLLATGYRAVNHHAISFDRLERLAERVHRLAASGALKWDAALAAALEVPQELVRPLLSELDFIAAGKRSEESYKRRRAQPAPPPAPVDPDSPFSVLARLRDTPR
ncbi:MAG TPA: helicase-related protein [Dongiaceae bacterium]|nr:helicase-related protein [Dongiaceae bacterium]